MSKRTRFHAIYMIAPTLAIALSSCTHSKIRPEVSRSVSAISARSLASTGESEFENTFQMLLEERDPAEAIKDHLQRQVGIYYRASKHLQDFDQELEFASQSKTSDHQWSLAKSSAYRKALTLRYISENSQDRITYIYKRLLEMRTDRGASEYQRKLARDMLVQFSKSLAPRDKIEALAMEDLRQELIETAARVGKTVKTLKQSNPEESIQSYFNNADEVTQAAKDTQDELKKRALLSEEAGSSDGLMEGIRKEEEQTHQALWSSEESNRNPQAIHFEPSTGSNGNINGSTFPANTWALTYDDGPSAKFTPGALANLASLKKKATFFWLAQNVKQYPDIVKKAIEAGMPVENHSYTHANLPKLGPQGLDKEIVQSTAAEAQIYGQKPKFFRCPYGAGVSVSRIRQKIAEQGMIHVFWNVDSLDWQDKNPDSILARVKKQMNAQKHGVVLFHDIHPQSIQASKMVLEWTDTMKGGSNEVRWVTLPEIVAELNGEKSK